jgi:hypothetical protein
MFVYLSKKLQKERPDLMRKVKKLADKPYKTVNIYDLWLDIMGITVENN